MSLSLENNNSKLKSMLFAGAAMFATLFGSAHMSAAHADTTPQEHQIINQGQQSQQNQSQQNQGVKVYTVVSGDTLSKIAKDNNISLQQLRQWNNKENTDLITVGEKLYVSEPVIKTTTTTVTTTHTGYTNGQNQQATSNSQNQAAQTTGQSQAAKPATNTNANTNSSSSISGLSASDQAAANWIAQHESSNNYNAQNGRYYGKYQLDRSYLHGDYSPENQDRTFVQYCNNRYGGVRQAQAFWQSHGWY